MTRADLDRVRRLGATPETRRAAAEALANRFYGVPGG